MQPPMKPPHSNLFSLQKVQNQSPEKNDHNPEPLDFTEEDRQDLDFIQFIFEANNPEEVKTAENKVNNAIETQRRETIIGNSSASDDDTKLPVFPELSEEGKKVIAEIDGEIEMPSPIKLSKAGENAIANGKNAQEESDKVYISQLHLLSQSPFTGMTDETTLS